MYYQGSPKLLSGKIWIRFYHKCIASNADLEDFFVTKDYVVTYFWCVLGR